MKRLSLAGLVAPLVLLLAGAAGCTPVADGATFADQLRGFVGDFLRQALAAYLT
jgi:hypothetical protein